MALVPGLVGADAGPNPARPRKHYSIEQLMDSTSILGGSFSADEKSFLYTSNASGVYNVYSVPVAGGKPRALVLTNERDAKFFDVFRVDAKTYARTLVYKDEVGYDFRAISDDGKWLAFVKPVTTSDSNIYLYNVETAKLDLVTKHAGPAQYQPQTFDPSSRWLYYTTDEGGEFLRLRRLELATGTNEDVARKDWDIVAFELSHGGKYQVMRTNVDGHTQVEVADFATGKALDLPALPDGEVRAAWFSRSERKLGLLLTSDRRPAELYVIDLAGRTVTRLTDSLNKQIDPDDLVDSKVVRFTSFDGMSIPNILFAPLDASAAHKAPALVYVHGGPGGQTRAGYNPLIQYLANHGYVILGINNRGSSGYGKTFFAADDRKHGHEPLDDCVAAKKYLQTLDYVDPARIGIIGGSYGGYMVLAALAFRPDEFAVGVDLFGVANWLRVLKSIPPYWETMRQAIYVEMGDPDKDAAMLASISPLLHTEGIKKPLLVLQGKNDPRVLEQESADIVAAVKKNGVPVEYVIFPDEGHGFRKKKNEIAGYRKILEFLDRHLRANPA